MSGAMSVGERTVPGADGRPPSRTDWSGSWLAVMMFVAFGALAIAILATGLGGLGALALVFLAVCALLLLILARYGRRSQFPTGANGSVSEGRIPERW